MIFFDRDQRSKVLKEALLFLLLLAWNQLPKMFQIEHKLCKGTKNVLGNKIVMFALYGLVWPCVALYGLVWPCVALCVLVSLCDLV